MAFLILVVKSSLTFISHLSTKTGIRLPANVTANVSTMDLS